MTPFCVGDKVVCVDDKPPRNKDARAYPLVKGYVYTIKAVNPHPELSDFICVRLVEETRRYNWGAGRFKPARLANLRIVEALRNRVNTSVKKKISENA